MTTSAASVSSRTASTDAFLDGYGDAACSLLSEAAARELMEDPDNAGYGSTCAAKLVAGAAIIQGFYGRDPERGITDVSVSGDRATAVSVFAGQRENVTYEREDGEWRIGPDRDDSESSGSVDQETADAERGSTAR